MLRRRSTSRPLVSAKVELGPPTPPNEFGGGTRCCDRFWLSMVERLVFLEIPAFAGMTYGLGFRVGGFFSGELRTYPVYSFNSLPIKARFSATAAVVVRGPLG